jgi:hypothetical protein
MDVPRPPSCEHPPRAAIYGSLPGPRRIRGSLARLERRSLGTGSDGPVPYLLLADDHTYRCRTWDQLVERLV